MNFKNQKTKGLQAKKKSIFNDYFLNQMIS